MASFNRTIGGGGVQSGTLGQGAPRAAGYIVKSDEDVANIVGIGSQALHRPQSLQSLGSDKFLFVDDDEGNLSGISTIGVTYGGTGRSQGILPYSLLLGNPGGTAEELQQLPPGPVGNILTVSLGGIVGWQPPPTAASSNLSYITASDETGAGLPNAQSLFADVLVPPLYPGGIGTIMKAVSGTTPKLAPAVASSDGGVSGDFWGPSMLALLVPKGGTGHTAIGQGGILYGLLTPNPNPNPPTNTLEELLYPFPTPPVGPIIGDVKFMVASDALAGVPKWQELQVQAPLSLATSLGPGSTLNSVTLSLSGAIPISQGGTGSGSYASNGFVFYNGLTAMTTIASPLPVAYGGTGLSMLPSDAVNNTVLGVHPGGSLYAISPAAPQPAGATLWKGPNSDMIEWNSLPWDIVDGGTGVASFPANAFVITHLGTAMSSFGYNSAASTRVLTSINNTIQWATAVLPENGGTGLTSTSNGSLLIGAASSSALGELTVGSNGSILRVVANAPSWAAAPAISLTGDVSGVLPTPNGGTGVNIATQVLPLFQLSIGVNGIVSAANTAITILPGGLNTVITSPQQVRIAPQPDGSNQSTLLTLKSTNTGGIQNVGLVIGQNSGSPGSYCWFTDPAAGAMFLVYSAVSPDGFTINGFSGQLMRIDTNGSFLWPSASIGQIRAPIGSAAAPSISFSGSGSSNTGFYCPAGGQMRWVQSGTAQFKVSSGGVMSWDNTVGGIQVPAGTNANPSYSWTTDTNSGMNSGGNNVIDLVCGNNVVSKMSYVGSNPQIQVQVGSVGAPPYSFISAPTSGMRPNGNEVRVVVAGADHTVFHNNIVGPVPYIAVPAGTNALPGLSFRFNNATAPSGLFYETPGGDVNGGRAVSVSVETQKVLEVRRGKLKARSGYICGRATIPVYVGGSNISPYYDVPVPDGVDPSNAIVTATPIANFTAANQIGWGSQVGGIAVAFNGVPAANNSTAAGSIRFQLFRDNGNVVQTTVPVNFMWTMIEQF